MRARCFWSACRSFLFDGGSCKSVLGGGGELSMAPANPEFRCILFVFFSSHDIAVYLSGCFRREVPTSSVSKTTCFGVQLPSAIACLLEALVVVFLTALFAVGKMVGGSGNFVLRVPINRDQP
ncbi:unnamed protein product [Brassica rapa]|uniref:Uncharacterized protein n=1 Tax=Brassica campestris TaxID=3711 RepID=A0A8D9I1D3_BRACM|nr:unnamed protein product [Brassica rapa]